MLPPDVRDTYVDGALVKRLTAVLLVIVVPALIVACGEAGAGVDATQTPTEPIPDYAIISLDPPTPGPNSVPAPTATTPPTPAPTATPTSVPTATPEIIDRGEVMGTAWSLALLTVEDMPPSGDWAAEFHEPGNATHASLCGVSNPYGTDAYLLATKGRSFVDANGIYFAGETITEYGSGEAAQQMLLDLEAYADVFRTCDPEEKGDAISWLEAAALHAAEISPIDVPPVGDDRFGYQMTVSNLEDEPEVRYQMNVVSIRIDQVLMVVTFGATEGDLPEVDSELIERAVEKVELGLTKPPTIPHDETPNTIPELDVATITTCEQAADAMMEQLQVILDMIAPHALVDLPQADEAISPDGPSTSFINDIERRAQEIGCDAEEFGALMLAGLDRLIVSGPTPQLVVDSLRGFLHEYEFDLFGP